MKRLLMALLSAASFNASAFTECKYNVDKIWMNSSGYSVWICFEGDPACIYKTKDQVSESAMERLYAAGTTAMLAEKPLFVRFNEDNASCETILATSRNDFVGFWILKK